MELLGIFGFLYLCTLLLLLFRHSVLSDSCNPMGCSPPGSSVHGIFQARILEWVAISFSGDLPDPGIQSVSSALEGGFFIAEKPGKPAFAHPLPNYLRYSISLSLTGWPLPISQALQTLTHLLQAAVLMSSNDLRALGTCSLFLWCCR